MLVVLVLLSFACGALAMHTDMEPRTNHAPMPEVRQTDESLILRRNPAENPPELPQIQAEYHVTRITTAWIEPQLTPIEPQLNRITVQFTEVEGPEGSRMIASTPDGRIIGGSDWTKPRRLPREYRWQAQAIRAWTPTGGVWGGSVGYTWGPVVTGIGAFPGQIQASIGIRW